MKRIVLAALCSISLLVACEKPQPIAKTANAVSSGSVSSGAPAVGQLAPEISGIDLEGVAFKLSDYRGKVVLLDFWGNW